LLKHELVIKKLKSFILINDRTQLEEAEYMRFVHSMLSYERVRDLNIKNTYLH